MCKELYKKLDSYRNELGLGQTAKPDIAIDDLIFSHKWLAHQARMVENYMKSMKETGLLEEIDVRDFDIFEMFSAIDKILIQREAMLTVINAFDLEKEYDTVLNKLLEE